MDINYQNVIEELQKNNLYDIQKELTKQRQTRTFIMSLLLSAFVFTFIYGTLENPFSYTLSNIGNFFNYRLLFIIWTIISGTAIEIGFITLVKLENYKDKQTVVYLYLATFFLIATGLIPALKEIYPFWHWMHVATSVLLSLFYTLSVIPFSLWISKENPRLRRIVFYWLLVIWVGSIAMIIIFQHSAMFEIWFFASMILYVLYLSLILFEEKIIKISIKLLSNEKNLNVAIEKVFVDLEKVNKLKLKKTKKNIEHKEKK
jgi:hypothetical protein